MDFFRLPVPTLLAFCFAGFTILQPVSSAQQVWKEWCGKHYERGSPATPPLGAYKSPPRGSFDLRCTPTLTPYLSTDNLSDASIMIDYPNPNALIDVVDRRTGRSLLHSGPITPGKALFKITDLGPPRMEPYSLTCRTSNGSQTVETQFPVSFLPPNPRPKASVVRKNAELGMLAVSDAAGHLKPFFPYGFYAGYGGRLSLPNASHIIQNLKEGGVNTLHPIPGYPYFTNQTELQALLTRLNDAGIWFQYDMRHSYQNRTEVDIQLKVTLEQPNMLAYYTADEPDGQPYSNATAETTQYLHTRDPYRPVSLVLNCQDFFFEQFTAGVDIVMTDPYPIALKSPTVSAPHGTVCNVTYGDCGCDNCDGNLMDLSKRMRLFKLRQRELGRRRTMMIWGVPQSFYNDDYWTRLPTGQEYLTSCAIFTIEGAVGLMAWTETDASAEIKAASAKFGGALSTMITYLASPQVESGDEISESNTSVLSRVWLAPDQKSMLLMAANGLGGEAREWMIKVPVLSKKSFKSPRALFSSAVVTDPHTKGDGSTQISGKLGGLGCGAWIIEINDLPTILPVSRFQWHFLWN